jgi:hypothetical protein
MGKGFARDTAPGRSLAPDVTFLRYTRDNGLPGDHAITRGLSTVVAFTGQSLVAPPNAATLLRLSRTAGERPTRADRLGNPNDSTPYTPRRLAHRGSRYALLVVTGSHGGRILSTEVRPLDRGADRDETACEESLVRGRSGRLAKSIVC